MDATLKAKWIAALRSGEYKQGQAMLRSASNKYCCLGVLCEVARVQYTGSHGMPPAGVFDHVGLSQQIAEDHLAAMNDGYGHYYLSTHTFAHIADWIDENL